NTGDDVEISGNMVCPDLDTVLYTLSDQIDLDTWFGVDEDNATTHDRIRQMSREIEDPYLPEDAQESGRRIARHRRFSGEGEFMKIGDRDRALHILRTSLIDRGHSLTEATEVLCSQLGIESKILPMSDDPVSTFIRTRDRGDVHFEKFWVYQNGKGTIEDIFWKGLSEATPTERVLDALNNPVIIGPSNPITSVGPILKLPGIREALQKTTVYAVAPFVGREVFSGPAARFMDVMGYEVGTPGLPEVYNSFLDCVVIDGSDSTQLDIPTESLDITLDTPDDRQRLALELKSLLKAEN
ncbi:MAG: 2-phospho-L-lactate transferase, partial [bacterium]